MTLLEIPCSFDRWFGPCSFCSLTVNVDFLGFSLLQNVLGSLVSLRDHGVVCGCGVVYVAFGVVFLFRFIVR